MKTINDLVLEHTDSPLQNNSRSIVRSKIDKFNKYPSESRAMEIERLTGASYDFSDRDFATEPPLKQE